jgi:type II secretory pathway pseudopilin PulG
MELLAVMSIVGLVAVVIGYWLETKHGAQLDRAARWMERH